MAEFLDLFSSLLGKDERKSHKPKSNTLCDNLGSGSSSFDLDMELAGKVVFITGAARGLGRCFAEKFLNCGAKVCVTDAYEEEGKAAAVKLQEDHGIHNVIFTTCNVAKKEDFEYAYAYCEDNLGKVDILINNAGMGNEQDWETTYLVNINGVTRGTLLAIEKMGLHNGGTGGAVVNISSVAGLRSIPFGPIYGASKHAIVGLSRDLGHPLHYSTTGVTVQCLCPGLVKTLFLSDSLQTPFSEHVKKALTQHAGKINPIEPSVVANALVKLLNEKKNGAVMVVEGDTEPYYVDPPLK